LAANYMDTLNLHIRERKTHPDWKILDVEPRPEVDFIPMQPI